jgi:hypothetical protein
MYINENTGLQTVPAIDSDIKYLLQLQEAFHSYTPREESEYSFACEVINDPFTEEDFRKIVDCSEAVILFDGNVPVGYVLIDTCSGSTGLQQFNMSISNLIEDENLDAETKQMPRFIEVLNPQLYQKDFDEVRWQMLGALYYLNRDKYKGFSFVFFSNADILIEKLNLGWKLAFDNGMYYYLVWEFSQLLDSSQ